MIAIARRFDLGEHYDDHQSEIAEMFAPRGLLKSIGNEEQFCAALAAMPGREVTRATTEPGELIAYLLEWIDPRSGRAQ